jgi:hypothetical protein
MTLKTVFQGDSVTIGFNLIGYDVARIQELKIYLGSVLYPHTIDGSVVRCELSSDLTANLLGIKPIFFWIDDTVFGVKNFNAGDIDFSYANPVHNGSINSGFDVIVNLNINQTEILVDSVLFDYFRGQNAYENAVLGGYSGTESEFNVMMSGFPNQEQTRISNENERISWYNVAINAISSALSTITGTNAEVVSQEAIRINSENIRIDSENTRVSWYNTAVSWYNNAVAATATAISNAITATTQANAARDAANAAANAGGSPKDSYLTLAALQAAFPTGATGIYLVKSDGHWYSYKNSTWTDGGVYMANQNDDYYNVTVNIPLSAGNYYTPLTAHTEVPLANRSIGKVITYLTALKEVDRLTIMHIPTLSGNVVVTLNGVDFTIAISTVTETTNALVAAKIASVVFTGWTVTYTAGNAYVDFTKSVIGVCSSPKFNGVTTGVTATNLATTAGSDPKWISEQFIGTTVIGGYWTDGGHSSYWKQLPETGGSFNSLRQIEINSAYIAGKLTYIDKKSTLLNPKINRETGWVDSYRVPISAIQFGNFLLDIKLTGTPEPGFTYGLSVINYGSAPGVIHNYYVGVSKFDSNNIGTIIFNANLNTPTDFEEIQEIELTTYGTSQATVTGARVLIFWNALKGASNLSHTYFTPEYGWYFNQEYLFDNVSNIGEFYNRNRINVIESGYVNKTDLNKYPILELPIEGTFETMFPYTGYYSNKNILVQTYTNRKTLTSNFNKIGIQFTAYKNDTIRIYRTNTYNPITGMLGTSNLTACTKLYETILTTDIQVVDINYFLLPDTFSLKQNESILVAVFSSGIPKIAQHVEVGRTYLNSYEIFLSTTNGIAENTTISHGGIPSYAGVPVRLLMDVQFLKPSDIPGISQQVGSNLALNPHLTLPAKIYCAVGVELNLWNDGIVLGTDRGLASPLEYQIHWYCSKGKIFERGFRFTPVLVDVGTTSLTVYVYGEGNILLVTKIVSLIVVANIAPSVSQNVVMAGDSLNSSAQITTPTRLNFVNLGGTVPSFIGSKGTSPNQHESNGGWKFSDFATQGRQRYRLQVTGVTSLALSSLYTQGGYKFSIDEINITGGTGNIAISKSTPSGDLTLPNGTLTKSSGAGDATINYTGAVLESTNPFWNPAISQVDFIYYCTQRAISVVNLLSIQCGINDNDLGADAAGKLLLKQYIETLYNKLIAHNSSAKMVVQLPSTGGNTKGGSGANYGATWETQTYYYNVFQIREYILANYDNNPLFPNLYIGIAGLVIDRYYGYNLDDAAISARYTTLEKVHTNSVHPGTSGYNQMGDGTYPLFLKLLQ